MIAVPRNLPISLLAAVVALTYGLHVFGPLRLVDDAPLYLSGAVDLADGRGYHDDHMPRGYSQALATLELVGLASPAGIVALNLFCAVPGSSASAPCCGMNSGFRPARRWSSVSCRVVVDVDLPRCRPHVGYAVFLPVERRAGHVVACQASHGAACRRVSRGSGLVSIGAFFVRTIGAALFVPVAISILERTVVNWGIVGRRKALWMVFVGGVCWPASAFCFANG